MQLDSIREEKSRLRQQIRQTLEAMRPEDRRLSDEALVRAFLALPQLDDAKTVLLYYGVGNEVNTKPLLSALLAKGIRVLLPRCLPKRQMEARLLRGEEDLIPGVFGIPEPSEACPSVAKDEIDLILAPALCCDRERYRLGQGGGYYDRYLSDYSGFTVALCRECLLQDALPHAQYDWKVSLVLTEKGSLFE